jgi:hypothetical protein
MTAGGKGKDDVVTRFEPSDAGADTLDNARTFVAEHDGQRHRIMLVAHVDVGLAEAGSNDPDQNFFVARLIKFERFESERGGRSFDQGGFDAHLNALRSRRPGDHLSGRL